MGEIWNSQVNGSEYRTLIPDTQGHLPVVALVGDGEDVDAIVGFVGVVVDVDIVVGIDIVEVAIVGSTVGSSLIIAHASLVELYLPLTQPLHSPVFKLKAHSLTSLLVPLNTGPLTLLPLQVYLVLFTEGHSMHCLLQNKCG